ncbi:hypothetical protein FQN57_006548 [Myotisia sp. PD_48]|nr:hypothetical protein FQN57_006548 [Myotisia sp. PD_48]
MTSYHRVSYQVKPHPYYPGKQLVIQSHFPPPAVTKFVLEEMQPDRTETPDHPLEESIRRPPLPGKDGNQTVEIEIIQEIRTGERHSAQLVLVKVGKCQPPLPDHSPQEGTVVVAKIYDPVYADWTDHDTLYAADKVFASNLEHRDLVPRNILINWKTMHVTFIDFGITRVYGHDDSPFFSGTYVSPLLRWKTNKRRYLRFREWIDWEWDPWMETVYGDTRNTITKEQEEHFTKQSGRRK